MAADSAVVDGPAGAPGDAPTRPQPVAAPARTPPAPAAKKADGKGDKKAKKSAKKAKGDAGDAGEAGADAGAPSVAAHPRATRAVARAKSWGGLLGFMVGGYLSLSTHAPAEAAVRALVAGLVCYVVVWAGAVFLWRRLVILEVKGREQQLLAAAQSRRGAGRPGEGAPSGPPAASPRAGA